MTIPKYRAYIKATDEMHQVAIVNTWLHTISTIPLPKKTSYGEITNQMRIYSFDEIDLMQYIELKDVNGIEIYRGDILTIPIFSIPDSLFTVEDVGVVKWIEKDARFMIDLTEEEQIITVECVSQYEIIGNIHESPDLVKEETSNE